MTLLAALGTHLWAPCWRRDIVTMAELFWATSVRMVTTFKCDFVIGSFDVPRGHRRCLAAGLSGPL